MALRHMRRLIMNIFVLFIYLMVQINASIEKIGFSQSLYWKLMILRKYFTKFIWNQSRLQKLRGWSLMLFWVFFWFHISISYFEFFHCINFGRSMFKLFAIKIFFIINKALLSIFDRFVKSYWHISPILVHLL